MPPPLPLDCSLSSTLFPFVSRLPDPLSLPHATIQLQTASQISTTSFGVALQPCLHLLMRRSIHQRRMCTPMSKASPRRPPHSRKLVIIFNTFPIVVVYSCSLEAKQIFAHLHSSFISNS